VQHENLAAKGILVLEYLCDFFLISFKQK